MSRTRKKRVLCRNRRQDPRFDVDFRGTAIRASQQGTHTGFEVEIQDLSAQGARLLSRRRIPVGEYLTIIVNGALQFRCRVTRIKDLDSNRFQLGVLMETQEPGANHQQPSNLEQMEGESLAPVALAKTDEINHQAFRKDRRLNKVLRFVEGHYDECISLKEAARVAAMEATYFSSFFRQKVGITYLNWLQHLRVAKAISLLEDENLTITDVAYQVGFNDLRTFQRAFKKHTHLTPRALRKKLVAAG